MAIAFTTKVSGPLFSIGRRALKDTSEETARELTSEGEDEAHNVLATVLQNPTGDYENTIRDSIRETTDSIHGTISDTGTKVAKSVWLERGGRGSKFRGYHIFQRIRKHVQEKTPGVIERAIDALVRKLNG